VKIVKHHLGLRFGRFTDVYEVASNCDRQTAIQRVSRFLSPLGVKTSGRAYDGAFVFLLSSWHEVAVYFRQGHVDIEDRFTTWIWLRLGPSALRRCLPLLVESLYSVSFETHA